MMKLQLYQDIQYKKTTKRSDLKKSTQNKKCVDFLYL